jgi:Flp pilus assembly pilin Flp
VISLLIAAVIVVLICAVALFLGEKIEDRWGRVALYLLAGIACIIVLVSVVE